MNNTNFFNQTPILNRFDLLVKSGQLADGPIPVGCTDPHALKLGCKVIDRFNDGSFTMDDIFADNLPINHPFAQIKKEISDHNLLVNAGWRNQSVELHTLDKSTGVVRFKFISRDESVAEGVLTSKQPSNFFFNERGIELNRREFLEQETEFSHAVGNTSDYEDEISSYPQTPSDSDSSSESEQETEDLSPTEGNLSSVEDYNSDHSNDNGGIGGEADNTGYNNNSTGGEAGGTGSPTVSDGVIQEASNTESSNESSQGNNSLITNEDSVSDTIPTSSLLADIEYLEILSDIPSLFEGAAY